MGCEAEEGAEVGVVAGTRRDVGSWEGSWASPTAAARSVGSGGGGGVGMGVTGRRSLVDVGPWVGSGGPEEGSCVKGRSMSNLDEEAGGVSDFGFGAGGAWIKEETDFDDSVKENVDLDCEESRLG